MASKRIEKILGKYLTNQASFQELDALELWIENPNNEQEFINYIKVNYLIDYNLKNSDTNKTKNLISKLVKEDKRRSKIRRIQNYVKYAAVFVGIMISIYFFREDLFISTSQEKIIPTLVNSSNVLPGTDKATLTLEDGSIVTLEKGDTYQSQNVNSNGQQIIYKAGERAKTEVAYNYLTIPRGGQFFVKLADGTQVWLNSESKLKYPINFIEGETRQVELVYGEAYFDVSPSTKHKGAKFKVFNQSQEVEVLGTAFNIKAYKDENNIYTTLVEGRVAINFENRIQKLIPNEQSTFNLKTKDLVITEVDVYNEISWKDGVFSFERKPLKEIMKVLSRWYDIEVVFEKKSLEDVRFFGVLGKDQKIEEILETIKKFKIIEAYEIKEKTIILK